MTWHDLLFLHWPVASRALAPLLPPSLPLDTFGGEAWLGVIPFTMSGVRPRWWPRRCGFAFAELNVRTYVTRDDRPGVWFFSLDAASRIAVRAARWSYGLPYYDARMRITRDGGAIDYASTRVHRGAPAAALAARYGPDGTSYRSAPGSLDAWLTDRYCLYATDRRGRLHRAEIAHAPWPLQAAHASIATNAMTDQIGVALPQRAPLRHFAASVDVVAWSPEPA